MTSACVRSARGVDPYDRPVLADLALILVAAKLAAEVCERVRVPAVVGEIVVGVLIGPSLLGWVAADSEPLIALAELGVLLLLVQVGMEMDLAELGALGRASMLVAVGGVAVPFVLGGAVGLGFGESGDTALFVGAALTATSVGITARVFGDLRALATTEARIVLGAAVADDVLGLVILTIVVKVVTEGSVSLGLVAETVGAAVGFLVVATLVGVLIVPWCFEQLRRITRSAATVVVLGFALMLGFAWAATLAKLAPIIGAFVAGLAIGRSPEHARIERDFAPTANLLIPVFFVQIGLNADVEAMARPAVLGLAGALLVVAIIGKLVSAVGAVGRSLRQTAHRSGDDPARRGGDHLRLDRAHRRCSRRRSVCGPAHRGAGDDPAHSSPVAVAGRARRRPRRSDRRRRRVGGRHGR